MHNQFKYKEEDGSFNDLIRVENFKSNSKLRIKNFSTFSEPQHEEIKKVDSSCSKNKINYKNKNRSYSASNSEVNKSTIENEKNLICANAKPITNPNAKNYIFSFNLNIIRNRPSKKNSSKLKKLILDSSPKQNSKQKLIRPIPLPSKLTISKSNPKKQFQNDDIKHHIDSTKQLKDGNTISKIYKIKKNNFPNNTNYSNCTNLSSNNTKTSIHKSNSKEIFMKTDASDYKTIISNDFYSNVDTKFIPTVYDCFKNDGNPIFQNKFLRSLNDPKFKYHNKKSLLLFSKLNDAKFHNLLNVKNDEIDDKNKIIINDMEINSNSRLSSNYDKDKIFINEYHIEDVKSPKLVFPNILEKSRMKKYLKNFGNFSQIENIERSSITTKSWNLKTKKFNF